MVDIDKFICSLLEHTRTYLSAYPDDAIKLALEAQGIVYKNNHLEGIGNNFNPSIIETKSDIKVGNMTQEDKKLLLADLCARLPHEVKIELMPITRSKCATLIPMILQDYFISDDVNYLPYLRPMSSMTEEEKEEFENLLEGIVDGIERWDRPDLCEEYDWLNKNHFDYRRLIEKGLALEAPEGMY